MGEANHAPLPPPPRIDEAPASKPAPLDDFNLRATGDDAPLNATAGQLNAAIQNDPTAAHETSGSNIDAAKEHKQHKKINRVLEFFRGATRGLVKTGIASDSVRAEIGSHHAKDRLGAVPPLNDVPISGPVEFKCRYEGKKGHVYLSTTATVPMLAFSSRETREIIGGEPREDLHSLWSIAVADIVELKKIGGYGWKAKFVVGWSMQREVTDGLEIGLATGEKYKITAVPLRDELLNRLYAMGGQKWEA